MVRGAFGCILMGSYWGMWKLLLAYSFPPASQAYQTLKITSESVSLSAFQVGNWTERCFS